MQRPSPIDLGEWVDYSNPYRCHCFLHGTCLLAFKTAGHGYVDPGELSMAVNLWTGRGHVKVAGVEGHGPFWTPVRVRISTNMIMGMFLNEEVFILSRDI